MLDLKLFAGSSNIVLAQNLARSLAIPLAKSEITQLSGGELRIRILEDVRNKTCVILQSLSHIPEQRLS